MTVLFLPGVAGCANSGVAFSYIFPI
jgi:hypothetical protein